jgi:hypothetical protein
MTVTLASYAQDQEMEWPFVILPHYPLLASKLLSLTNGLYVVVVPSVTPAQKQEREQYAYQHDFWVNESLAIQEVSGDFYGDILNDWTRSKKSMVRLVKLNST